LTCDLVTCYLGLGSNIGDRHLNLERAIAYLGQRLQVDRVSSVYDTPPLGETDQPRFLNLVCRAYTRLSPQGLLLLSKGIESKMGRMSKTGQPRPIDIDILFYDDRVLTTPDLVIPHPRLSERAFVLVPLGEIAPEFTHPVSHETVAELLARVDGVADIAKIS